MGRFYDRRGMEKGFDYKWKNWCMRIINVSLEEEKEMTEREFIDPNFKKNPNIKKTELKTKQGRNTNMETIKAFEKEGDRTLEYSEAHPGRIGIENIPRGQQAGNTRALKWTSPVRPLPEDITTWSSEDGKFLDNISINDKIIKASNNNLTDPLSSLGAIEPASCDGLLRILELCKRQQNQQPFPYTVNVQSKENEYPLWATILTQESSEGSIADGVIQSIMSEVMRFNSNREFDVQGLWDVPRFIELNKDQEIPWASDIAVGIAESHDNRKMVEGNIDWNGKPPPSTRKITVLVCLSDSNNYEGGEFELITDETKQLKMSMGDVIMWPSFLARRVRPVTKGKLIFLQIFNNGAYFK